MTALLFAATFAVQVLKVEGAVQGVTAQDLDGDGDSDLLVFSVVGEKRGERERRVSWFTLGPAGFPQKPDLAWTFDAEGSIADLGRARDGSSSLYYCVADGVRRYRLSPGRMPQSESVHSGVNVLGGRSEEAFYFYDFVRDWFQQGFDTPAIFQPGRILLFREDPRAAPVEVRLRTEVELFDLGTPVDFRPRLPLFVSQSLPAVTLADWDGDGRRDLVAGLGERVEVHLAKDARDFSSEPSWTTKLPVEPGDSGENPPRPSVQLEDFNGDGSLDALLSTFSGSFSSLKNTAQLFLGSPQPERSASESESRSERGGGAPRTDRSIPGGLAARPSASLEFRGAFAQVVPADLDGDGKKELIVASLPLGISSLLKILLTRRVSVKFTAYGVDAEGRLSRPILEWSQGLAVSFSTAEDFPVFTLSGDFDGDGMRDLVSAPSAYEISVRRIEKKRDGWELGRELARFTTPSSGQAVAVDLYRKGRSDLILYRPRATRGKGEVRVFLNR